MTSSPKELADSRVLILGPKVRHNRDNRGRILASGRGFELKGRLASERRVSRSLGRRLRWSHQCAGDAVRVELSRTPLRRFAYAAACLRAWKPISSLGISLAGTGLLKKYPCTSVHPSVRI